MKHLAFAVVVRELIAAHTDSKTYGPLSAAQRLKRLNKWRAEHPQRSKAAQ